MRIHGLDVSTKWHKLANFMTHMIELKRSNTDHFSFFDEDVTPIKMLSIKTQGGISDCKWFLEKILLVDISTQEQAKVDVFGKPKKYLLNVFYL